MSVKKKILIVEDNVDTAEMEALELIKSGLAPACVLMDYMTPGMPLTAFLHETERFNLKIFLMTGHHDSVATAQLPGICGSLQKPISADLVVQTIEKIIG
jgi:DNA-binding NtrC family response regulator